MEIIHNDIRWRLYQGALIPDIAPHIEISLTKEDEFFLLKKSKALFLRYTTQWDTEKSNFWYVIKDSFGGIEELSKNSKRNVKRGLARNNVVHSSKENIAFYCYDVYYHAFSKYNTFLKLLSKADFEDMILSKDDTSDFFLAINKDNNVTVAYACNTIKYGACELSSAKFTPEYLKHYPSEALFYEMHRYYLEELKLSYVNDGARSISHDTNIQDFLINKFKYRKAYCRLHVVYRKDVGLIVRILFPFRGLIKRIPIALLKKVSVLLKQEEIRRSYE